jgi:methylthioribose-1-phosphate isomerase
MIPLEIIGWSAVAATAAWGLTLRHASAAVRRLHADMRDEVRRAQAETARARTHAAQLSRELASWRAGCQQGREEVMTLMPLLLARTDPASTVSPPAAPDSRP